MSIAAGTRPIAVIGFMGAGKSTAAHSAANALGTEAVDVDRVVERRLGRSIERVFAEDGEQAFREVEERITLELLEAPGGAVLALGGGATGSRRTRAALEDHLVIWLDVDVQTAWARAKGTGRPLAHDRGSFERLHREREPVYAALADVVVPAPRSTAMGPVLRALEHVPAATKVLWAANASGDYPAYIGAGLLDPDRFWPPTVTGRRFLVTDGHVGRLYAGALEPLAGRVAIMPGEQSKTVAHAEIV